MERERMEKVLEMVRKAREEAMRGAAEGTRKRRFDGEEVKEWVRRGGRGVCFGRHSNFFLSFY